MPRVSEEHLERRRQQILDAARDCFVRKGVYETSMQDIFAEADLSSGAVYRYFKSKSEIIDAIMSTTIGDLIQHVTTLVRADPLLPLDEVVLRLAERIVSIADAGGAVRLAPQAWALALYDAEMHVRTRTTILALRSHWVEYIRRATDEGLLPPDTDAEVAGKTLFVLLPGFLVQFLLVEDISAEEFAAGVRTLVRGSLVGAPAAG